MEIIIFTNTGQSLTFKNVANFKHSTQGFSFKYTGVSTGVTRKAEFNYTSVAGYAIN